MGRINSIETMGALDGPGIRTIVFFQGCNLRCLYCHNPDMWKESGGYETSAEEVAKIVARYRPYYGDKGGVTFSGGEPLIQPEFLLECLKACKAKGVHTTLDTAGNGAGNYDEILAYTDLVILDVKHEDPASFQRITGCPIDGYLAFKEAVNLKNKAIWLKHVVVPGLTNQPAHIKALKKEIFSFNNISKVELLPYHTMGVTKYEKMGIPYKLAAHPEMNPEKLKELQDSLLRCEISENIEKSF